MNPNPQPGATHGAPHSTQPKEALKAGWRGGRQRVCALLVLAIMAVSFLWRPLGFKSTVAQSVSTQNETEAQDTPEAHELTRWISERTDREVLIIDQIVSQKKHPKLSENEVVEFGMLNSSLIHRFYRQAEGSIAREQSMRTLDRITNPDRYIAEHRSQMTPVEVERQRAAVDAFMNAFPQFPPSPAPQLSIPTREESDSQ